MMGKARRAHHLKQRGSLSNTGDNMDNQRLIDIEMKLAYQERMIAELNAVVIEQQKTLDDIQKANRALIDRIRDLSENLAEPLGGHEKPPHY